MLFCFLRVCTCLFGSHQLQDQTIGQSCCHLPCHPRPSSEPPACLGGSSGSSLQPSMCLAGHGGDYKALLSHGREASELPSGLSGWDEVTDARKGWTVSTFTHTAGCMIPASRSRQPARQSLHLGLDLTPSSKCGCTAYRLCVFTDEPLLLHMCVWVDLLCPLRTF